MAAAEERRDPADDCRRIQHAGLDGGGMKFRPNRFDLLTDDFWTAGLDGQHLLRILRGDARDRARAMNTQRRERLQVRLDAGAAAAVRAGDA